MLQSQGFDLTYKELHILLLTLNVNGNFNLAHPKEWEVEENTNNFALYISFRDVNYSIYRTTHFS